MCQAQLLVGVSGSATDPGRWVCQAQLLVGVSAQPLTQVGGCVVDCDWAKSIQTRAQLSGGFRLTLGVSE